jgi:hypothetical protein
MEPWQLFSVRVAMVAETHRFFFLHDQRGVGNLPKGVSCGCGHWSLARDSGVVASSFNDGGSLVRWFSVVETGSNGCILTSLSSTSGQEVPGQWWWVGG